MPTINEGDPRPVCEKETCGKAAKREGRSKSNPDRVRYARYCAEHMRERSH